MAPCPMLMTPISPNTTAKPSAAKREHERNQRGVD